MIDATPHISLGFIIYLILKRKELFLFPFMLIVILQCHEYLVRREMKASLLVFVCLMTSKKRWILFSDH